MRKHIHLTFLLLSAAATAHAATPFERQFRDWRVACSNLGHCAAHSNDPEHSGWTGVILHRAAGPGGAMQASISSDADISVDGGMLDLVRGWQVVDGRRRTSRDPAAIRHFIDTVRNAQELEIAGGPDGKGDVEDTVSLHGLSAALLFIDEFQGRLGSEDAWIRRGPRKPASVPAAPRPAALPAFAPARAFAKGEAARLLTAARKGVPRGSDSDCDPELAAQGEAHPLTRDEALVMVVCWRGAYQEGGPVLRVSRTAPYRAMPLALPLLGGETTSDLTFAGFDPRTGELSHFAKGRGIGDCGEAARWRFDGRGFRLVDYRVMPTCSGFPPASWPALVGPAEPAR